MKNLSCTIWGKEICLKSWQPEQSSTVLALHGWLDNAGSFDNIAPLLRNVNVIAPDLAGHGLSARRSADSAYNIWQDAGDMDQIIRQLDIAPVILMGHSRGAMIATILAALYPEQVKGLILLDGIMPIPVSVEETVDQLRRAFDDRRRYLSKPPRYYASYEEAIQFRMKGPLGLSRDAVNILAKRGLARDEKGYAWRADPRLRSASEVKLTEAHSLEFIKALHCPARVILSLAQTEYIERLLAANADLRVSRVGGGHHLHLEQGYEEVALLINGFLASL